MGPSYRFCLTAAFCLLLNSYGHAALCDPSATFPNTWGQWSEWGACSATGCDTQGFQTRNAEQCFVGKSTTPAGKIAQCPPKAHPLFKACSQQQQPCKSPPCENYKWTYKIDYTECKGPKACTTQTTGKAQGTCCADASVDNGQECGDPVNPQSSCQGFSARRSVDVPCVVSGPCGKTNINTADFDPAKCTNNVAQAEFVNGLGRLLGLVPGQIKITSTVGCNQRRQADGGQVEWQFITPCGVKAQQLYQEQLDAGGKNPITRYLAANDVVKATVQTESGETVVSQTIPPNGESNDAPSNNDAPADTPADTPPDVPADVPAPPVAPQIPTPPTPPTPPNPPTAAPTWSAWGTWSACSATCGDGQRFRQRVCIGGNTCPGAATDTGTCGNAACPGNPGDLTWSAWSSWSACSGTCGPGLQTRTRTCPSAIPFACGLGQATETQVCQNDPCQTAQWSAWGDWGPCSVTCGSGQQSRTRECTEQTTTSTCPGTDTDTRPCNEGTCPSDDCTWQWIPGPNCVIAGSGTCGSGLRAYMCNIINQPSGSTCCTDSPPPPDPCEVSCPENWSACNQVPTDPNSCTGSRYNLDNPSITEPCSIYRVGTWSAWTCVCSPTCVNTRTCSVRECGPSTGCTGPGATDQGGECSNTLSTESFDSGSTGSSSGQSGQTSSSGQSGQTSTNSRPPAESSSNSALAASIAKLPGLIFG